jgi:4-amino-4-deoxy-L-arabinose transferase-like glycosyltransferase
MRSSGGQAWSRSHRFSIVLALIVVAAFGLRVVYVVTVAREESKTHLYDATYYELQARSIAQGDGFFDDPFLLYRHPDRHEPAADHPPFTTLALLPAALVADPDASNLAMRLTMVVIGTATVALIGLLTRRLAGDTAGLVAAGIAALDPNLWMNDGLIMAEALSVLITVALVAMAFRVMRGGASWRWVVALGVVSGIGVLTRAELALYVPFLVFPALWIGSRDQRGKAVGMMAGACVVVALVLAPWVGYNLSRFEQPTLLSTNDGVALLGASCDTTYFGSAVGWASVFAPCVPDRNGRDQSVWNNENRSAAFSYMREHLDRLPVVALARLGRNWLVYKPGQTAAFATFEGRPEWATWMGAVVAWALLPLAVSGSVVLRRRRQPIWPLIVPIVTTFAVVALIASGVLRYRATAEPSFIILGAVAVVALLGRLPDTEHDTSTVDVATADSQSR